ncbi:hypothetical protein TWF281_002563 [Arthrobotrys megalospora]
MYQYVGKINHVDGYARNELFTILFPTTIREGNKASVVMQWTRTYVGEEKSNDARLGTITRVVNAPDGTRTVELFRGEFYYWYECAINENEDEMTIRMLNQRDEFCSSGTAKLHIKEQERVILSY